MKVLLLNEAEYEFNESKMQNIPFEAFNLLRDKSAAIGMSTPHSKLRVFKNMGEFNRIVTDEDINLFDTDKGVFLSPTGNIFIFLKEENTDATTNSEENKGE